MAPYNIWYHSKADMLEGVKGGYSGTENGAADELDTALFEQPETLADRIRPKPGGSGRVHYHRPKSPDKLNFVVPELLSEAAGGYRHRLRTNLRLQLIDKLHPVLLSEGKEFEEAVAFHNGLMREAHGELSVKEVFPAQSKAAKRMALKLEGIQIITERTRQDKQGTKAYDNELAFLLDNLPAEEREIFDREYAEGKPIRISVGYGEKHQFVQFSDGSVRRFDYPKKMKLVVKTNPGATQMQKDRAYVGSNFISFLKAGLSRDEVTGELRLSTRLVTEVNIGTKTQSATIKDGEGKLVKTERSLADLQRRHREGDPLLREEEFLYNQFSDLYDIAESDDQKWIYNSLNNFIKFELKHKKYRVLPNTSKFNLVVERDDDFVKRLAFDNEAIKENSFADRPLRLNVKKGSWLESKLQERAKATAKVRNRDKFVYFSDNAYPSIHRLLVDPDVGVDGVCEQLVNNDELRRKFIGPSKVKEGDHLAYLIHKIGEDDSLAELHWSGEGRSRMILEKLSEMNSQLRVPVIGFDDKFIDLVMAKAKAMQHKNYFAAQKTTRQVMRVKVENKLGPNRRRVRDVSHIPEPDRDPLGGPLAEYLEHQDVAVEQAEGNGKNGKKKKYLLPDKRDNLSAFDLTPKVPSISEVQEELVGVAIEYFRLRLIKDPEWKPRILEMFLDETAFTIRGSKYSSADIMRAVRRATTHKPGAWEAFCGKAKAEVARRKENQPDIAHLEEMFDYSRRKEATSEASGKSGALGEIFLRLAIKYGFAELMGLNGKTKDYEIVVTYIDRDRQREKRKLKPSQRRLLANQLMGVWAEVKDQHTHGSSGKSESEDGQFAQRRPDMIVEMMHKQTGEKVELWFDSKTPSKMLTPVAVGRYHEIYEPYLNEKRILVLVANSREGKIYDEGRARAKELGVVLLEAEQVKKALRKIPFERFNLESTKRVIEEYDLYARLATVYAEDANRVETWMNVERIMDLENTHPIFGTSGAVEERLPYVSEAKIHRQQNSPARVRRPKQPVDDGENGYLRLED